MMYERATDLRRELLWDVLSRYYFVRSTLLPPSKIHHLSDDITPYKIIKVEKNLTTSTTSCRTMSLRSYQCPWSSHCLRSSKGGCAPHCSRCGILRSSTNNTHYILYTTIWNYLAINNITFFLVVSRENIFISFP